MANEQYELYQQGTAAALAEAQLALLGAKADKGGEAPTLVAGSSRAVLGDAETASWTERTTAADGAALIEAIRGNTVVQDGSLLPVRMEGVETVGFNQWDETWEVGGINTATGENMGGTSRIRSKGFIPAFPNTQYYSNVKSTDGFCILYYDADKTFISGSWIVTNNTSQNPFTTPNNCRYIRFTTGDVYGGTYNYDICINISDPSRNGTYDPYWSSQRTIPAVTYFPQGMRSAGSVYDELRADAAVTRVGAVDLGTLNWTYDSTNAVFLNTVLDKADGQTNMACGSYSIDTAGIASMANMTMKGVASGPNIYFKNTAYTDAAAFKTAMSGVVLYYALATPTTTPIDPPLPLSYRVGAGGTERVMVESGTTSAPPIFVTRYPLDPADLAASIAPVDGPIAKTNHQVGDLLMLGFTLCKATQVIVTGETIAIGTNVTKTTVAAELAALS